jgi:dCTP deaminase
MYLPDHEIRAAIQTGHLGVDPYDPMLVQPASLDLRLHRRFLVLRGPGYLDPSHEAGEWERRELAPRGQVFDIEPGDFVLASTLERIRMPDDLLARLEGKSSIGRLGLRIHSTAGFIDPGFEGRITLELSVDSGQKIALWPGMLIGQLSLARLSAPAEHPYGRTGNGSHYQGQDWPTPSRSWQRFTAGPPAPAPRLSRW